MCVKLIYFIIKKTLFSFEEKKRTMLIKNARMFYKFLLYFQFVFIQLLYLKHCKVILSENKVNQKNELKKEVLK